MPVQLIQHSEKKGQLEFRIEQSFYIAYSCQKYTEVLLIQIQTLFAKQFSFPPLLLQPQIWNKNIAYISFYQSQHAGVFHNQVLWCASRTYVCRDSPEKEVSTRCCETSHAITTTLSWLSVLFYLAYTLPQPTKQRDGTTRAACAVALSSNRIFLFFFCTFLFYAMETALILCRQFASTEAQN